MNKCVIDSNGLYVEYVEVIINEETGLEETYCYTLKDGENLIQTNPPLMKENESTNGFIIPKWNEEQWIESATETQIRKWNEDHPAPVPIPTDIEILQKENKLLKAQITALSEQQEFLEDCLIEVGQVIYA